MPGTTFRLELRDARLEDAALVADLETSRDPSEPRDPVLQRHRWRMTDELEKGMRRVDVRAGAAIAYISAAHELWRPDEKRFGVLRPMLRADVWSGECYDELVEIGEGWLRAEGAGTAVVRVREEIKQDIAALERIGYREDRRMRISELDLVANRDRILNAREECRRRIRGQRIEMHPLSEDADPDRFRKLYEMSIESERDIPTTVPWRVVTFEEWMRFWFENPTIGEDWYWIAREGDAIIGTSVLEYPVMRGIPWTSYTGTSRSVRGRGIARALKYESIGQAIEAGKTRVRTSNDADNPPILRINEEMGYRFVAALIELHRNLDA
jgi:RimJ/RimL family protein N-acetyltransferase